MARVLYVYSRRNTFTRIDLEALRERYEVHHGVRITDGALVAAAVLSNRYITERFLPDKAIDLVDEAASRLRMEIDSSPVEIDVLRRADPLVVNEHVGSLALRMLGEHAHGDHAVVAALVDSGVPSVVMTRGAKGALVGGPEHTAEVRSP